MDLADFHKRQGVYRTGRRALFAGLLLALVGLVIGSFGLKFASEKLDSYSWPSTYAEVLGIGTYGSIKSGSRCLQVRYQYVIGTETYVSSRLALLNNAACYRDARVVHAILAQFKPGAPMRIRYDPLRPETSVVFVRGLGLEDLVFWVPASACLGLGMALARRGRAQVP